MYNFNGRPDGLGNRMEELIFLKSSISENLNYFWNNNNNRKYNIEFEMEGVTFTSHSLNQNTHISRNVDQDTLLKIAKTIKPKFNVYFETQPVGIHIRKTDKIVKKPGINEMSIELFNKCLEHTIQLLNKYKYPNIYVCSDDIKTVNYLFSKLNYEYNVQVPLVNSNSKEFNDFFSLTKCSKIIMCSLFSSYAITASMIGNVPLVSYFTDDKSSLNRYKAIVEYELM
jgi:hypothetical protein